jgi:hypothetical protein
MLCRRAEHDSGHHADFRAANFGKYVYGIVSIRMVDFESATNYLDFVGQAGIINPGSSASYGFRIATKQDGSDRTRRRGISYTHFADTDEIDSRLRLSLR